MRKIIIIAVAALAVVGCSKSELGLEPGGGLPADDRVPIVFGTTAAGVEVRPVADAATSAMTKAVVTVDDDVTGTISVYAFRGGVMAPTTQATADAAKVGDNLEFTFDATDVYSQATPTLYWPGSGSSDKMHFVSYFPRQTSGIGANYVLTADFSDQIGGPDYGFAWAKTDNVARPMPVTSVALAYNYKVAKITFEVRGDDGALFGTEDGLGLSSAVTTKGVAAIRLYSKETATGVQGLKQDYALNLLTGAVSVGSTLANSSAAAIQLKPEAVAREDADLGYVTATGYLVPVTAMNTTDVIMEIVYNDGVEAQAYTGTIAKSTNLSAGIEAGKHYKFTATLTAREITFSGQLVDWDEVDMRDTPIELEEED